MENVDSRYKDGRPDRRAHFRAYARTYDAADKLFVYMYERWRSDPALYHHGARPFIDSRFGIISEFE